MPRTMTMANYESPWKTEDARIFQRTVRSFVETELAPQLAEPSARPDADTRISGFWTAVTWAKAGEAGLLLPDVPDQYGGAGGTFAHEAVVIEELARAGAHIGFGIQSIVA